MSVSRRGFVRSAATLGAAALAGGGLRDADAAGAPPSAAGDHDGGPWPDDGPWPAASDDPTAPETSTFVGTARIGYYGSVRTASDGDLWANCWADDGALYAANGDGRGFSSDQKDFADTVVNRIDGTPATGLTGSRLAAGDQLTPVWSDASKYNRKPTGMTCVDGSLYLAIQDLRYGDNAFDDAPAASITRSDDHGRTWHPTAAPMFTDHRFTTVVFLDFGRAGAWAAAALGRDDARYVYAYGLDHNWRDSFTNTVPDPQSLYLARVPRQQVQDRTAWRFFAGLRGGRPTWSGDIVDKVPVLHDERHLYPDLRASATDPHCLSVVSQGGVTYLPALRRYVYTSWTEYTFELYEAPQPWGPWRLFLEHDAGGYPWFGPGNGVPGPKNGGYGLTVPSKFVSDDGLSMWVQTNWFVGNGGGANDYQFNLRPLSLAPATGRPLPVAPTQNLARLPSAVPTLKSAHYGHAAYLDDGDRTAGEDSFDGSNKPLDWWGYTWPGELRLGRLVYTTGRIYADGGWFSGFDGGLRVQVRRRGRWTDATGLTVSPDYPYSAAAGPWRTYTLRFAPRVGDGVRLIGPPGGSSSFTSIAELEVYSS